MLNAKNSLFASIFLSSALTCFLQVSASEPTKSSPLFFAKPYLQLGNHPHAAKEESEDLLWLSTEKKDWAVDVKAHEEKDWTEVKTPIKHHLLENSQHPNLEIYDCELTGLKPGELFDYRVRTDKPEVFHATGQARKTASQPLRIAIFGDCAAGTPAQTKIAYECEKFNPDLVVVPGDVVYDRGLLSEYETRFFPVYNSDKTDPKLGGPILRSHLFVPVLGNHDIAFTGKLGTDLDRFPDGLAYYTVWSQPLNGPVTKYGAKNATPIRGEEDHKREFLNSAGENFPRMANYSFDYGNTHWLVLDANYYMDWTDDDLRDWVKKDLTGAKKSRWKFVTFHQPGFSDDIQHNLEQRMRVLSDIFEQCNVDVVFAGHVHNYQRSYPLFFKPEKKDGKIVVNPNGTVSGTFKLDKTFDGRTETKPNGVLYIVTGAGGQHLYPEKTQTDKTEFICTFNGKIHSYTACDINGDTMSVKQIDEDGHPIDEFKLTKK